MEDFDDTLWLCRTGHDDLSHTRLATLAVILSELFPLDTFRCNFVSALQLEYHNTLWNVIMILHSYLEEAITMCRIQE